jgi:ABC-2 type transport system ATP-binding protein
MSSAISVTGLRKAYGNHTVLDGIALDVGEGTIFSLLGPNGAGKTTTVEILATLQTPTPARCRWRVTTQSRNPMECAPQSA